MKEYLDRRARNGFPGYNMDDCEFSESDTATRVTGISVSQLYYPVFQDPVRRNNPQIKNVEMRDIEEIAKRILKGLRK